MKLEVEIPDDSDQVVQLMATGLLSFVAKVASAEARFRTLSQSDFTRLTSSRTARIAMQDLQDAVDEIKNPMRAVKVADDDTSPV